jgi:octaprenyl-diphosphate synthase
VSLVLYTFYDAFIEIDHIDSQPEAAWLTITVMNLSSHLAPDFERLNHCIQSQLHSDVALVQQVATYIVHAGGKRMRPAMLMLAADVLGLRDDKRTTQLAAVVEFIHTATLLHDDVVDESHLRRGKQTANALFGNAASVLVGDFLYSRAFQMMVQCGNSRVMEVLADATNVIAEGEVLQLMHIGDASLTEAQYLKVIEYKTAKLFEAAARLPAVLVGNSTAELALATYGRKVGAAFQIVDDVLDYEGDATKLGKNLGDDLREGKVTLPLIFAMQNGTAEQQRLIQQTIVDMQTGQVDENTMQMRMQLVLQTVQSLNSTKQAVDVARRLVSEALLALDQFDRDAQPVKALIALAQQAIVRTS